MTGCLGPCLDLDFHDDLSLAAAAVVVVAVVDAAIAAVAAVVAVALLMDCWFCGLKHGLKRAIKPLMSLCTRVYMLCNHLCKYVLV